MTPKEYKDRQFATGKPRYCWMCKCPLTPGTATVDHLICKSSKKASWSKKNDSGNFRLACGPCNSSRGNRRLSKDELKAAKGRVKASAKSDARITAHQHIAQLLRVKAGSES